ncbi:hypothetical protein [Nannocystis pusilla]|uniref:hypothetical protein n=1 Tax=Nannocystis pusilla TaxID=889268 RepID=UPI003B7E84B5
MIVLPAADPLELAELAAESSPALVDVEVDVDVDEPSLELVPGGAVVMLGRIPAHSPLIRGLAGEVQLGDGRVTVRPDGTLPERPGSLVLSIRPGAFGWPWLVPVRP